MKSVVCEMFLYHRHGRGEFKFGNFAVSVVLTFLANICDDGIVIEKLILFRNSSVMTKVACLVLWKMRK
jgi:hypothetical protein